MTGNDASYMPTSLMVWNLEHFKYLIFVAQCIQQMFALLRTAGFWYLLGTD
jgi:hypothetical protein